MALVGIAGPQSHNLGSLDRKSTTNYPFPFANFLCRVSPSPTVSDQYEVILPHLSTAQPELLNGPYFRHLISYRNTILVCAATFLPCIVRFEGEGPAKIYALAVEAENLLQNENGPNGTPSENASANTGDVSAATAPARTTVADGSASTETLAADLDDFVEYLSEYVTALTLRSFVRFGSNT